MRTFKQAITICTLLTSLWLTTSASSTAPSPDSLTNLLPGDPSFEVGFDTWHAYSAPWKKEYLANRNFVSRLTPQFMPEIRDDRAYHGSQSVHFELRSGIRSYLTTTKKIDLPAGTYTLQAKSYCSAPTTIRLRLANATPQNERDFYNAMYRQENRVTQKQWSSLSLSFTSHQPMSVIPVLDLVGNNSQCWIDALSLTKTKAPVAPYPATTGISATLRTSPPYPTAMPQLYLTTSDTPAAINMELSARVSGEQQVTLRLRGTVESPEGIAHPITVPETLIISPGTVKSLSIPLELPATGIWKVKLTLSHPQQGQRELETVFARIRPHTGKPDSFFGSHQKWTSLTDIMGFGAVRDMHLLAWDNLNPNPGRWTWPDDREIQHIKRYIDRGGLYMATLVAEAPKRTAYADKTWGKTSYGAIPLWAGADKDTEGGLSKHVSREIRQDALTAYVEGIASKFPYLTIEVMNEPNHFMTPEEYLPVLKTSYKTIKRISPSTTVVAFANPPYWHYLPRGSKAFFGVQPYYWFEQAFQSGALKYADAVSVHTYDQAMMRQVPENGYGTGQAQWAAGLRKIMTQAGGPVLPIWMSEKGISSPSWRADRYLHSVKANARVDSAITQARWLVRSQLDMMANDIKHFFIFNSLWDTGAHERFYPDEDGTFSFYDVDGLPRPALVAQRTLIELLSHARHISGAKRQSKVRYETFIAGGKIVTAIWSYENDEAMELASKGIAINCPMPGQNATLIDMYGQARPYRCDKTLQATPSPIYLVGDNQEKIETWLKGLY